MLNNHQEFMESEAQKWVGELPEGWKLVRNQGLFDETKIVGHSDEEMLSVTIEHGIIPQAEVAIKKDSSNEDKSKYKLLEPGDLAYNKMRMWQGAIGRSEYRGIVSPAYVTLRPRDPDYSRYFHYVYRTHRFITEANRNSYGLCDDMNSLRYEHFKTIRTPIPPKDALTRIVKFLDEKTAEIDAAVEKKRRLIDLLNEQKAILINRAVTKGLNSDAPMKDSGVDWIGEIPAHWDVKRFKHCVRTQSGQVNPTRSPYKEMILVAPNHIVQGTGETLAFETADEQGADSGKYFANAGCIIYSKIRPKLNKACIVDFDALCSADMYALQGYPEYFTQQYLLRQILSECFVIPAVDASMRVAMPKVNREAMAEFPMIIPPKPEQEKIVRWLDRRLADVRAPEKATLKEIATLNEFKQTLIANAVTGKIKIEGR